MTGKKDEIVSFLQSWAAGKKEVYDVGSERKRNTLKDLTKEHE